ncbi:MAG: shikimate dehydrogenase, partial [Zoogloeaceae bacterium]|nr:shikimate dehydrogenase [Zoogloeaceae bacterium]
MDRYAVIGNPIAHSKSPQIHAAFAAQTGQRMHYEALLAPLDGFRAAVDAFRRDGGRGLNVTVPFKLEAHALADTLSPRAEAAGAVNTLRFDNEGVLGDNTDGAGLVRDLLHNLAHPLGGTRVLLLGAGGAARGAVLPLLDERPARLVIANRTVARATELSGRFSPRAIVTELTGCGFADLAGQQFDLVINATASSLSDEAPALPSGVYAEHALAYDMMYGRGDTAFMAAARAAGAARLADRLGRLVEPAAARLQLWRGVGPATPPGL